jgi:LPXTG-motif cell wall-anchored protein
MSEQNQSENAHSARSGNNSNSDSEYRFDTTPQSSRIVIDGLLGIILAIAGIFILATGWESMGIWSVVFGLLILVGAVFVIRFPFTMK